MSSKAGAGVEFRLDEGERLLRRLGIRGKYGDHAVLVDDDDPRQLCRGGRVDALQRGAVRRRAEDLRVEHSRQADVPGVLGLARHLRPRVAALLRLPHQPKLGDGFRDRLPVQFAQDLLPLGELAERDPGLSIGGEEDHPVLDPERVWRRLELLRGKRQQNHPGFRRRSPEGRTEEPGRHGAVGPVVEWTEGRVSHEHVDRIQGHGELVGRHLRQRRDDSLPHLDLPGVDRDPAVAGDPEIRVEVGRIAQCAGFLPEEIRDVRRKEDDDAPAEELDEVPAIQGAFGGWRRECGDGGEFVCHDTPPGSVATRSMAWTIR